MQDNSNKYYKKVRDYLLKNNKATTFQIAIDLNIPISAILQMTKDGLFTINNSEYYVEDNKI